MRIEYGAILHHSLVIFNRLSRSSVIVLYLIIALVVVGTVLLEFVTSICRHLIGTLMIWRLANEAVISGALILFV